MSDIYTIAYEIACVEFRTDNPTDEQINEIYEDFLVNPPELLDIRNIHER